METGARFHLIIMIFLTPVSFGAMALVIWWFFTQKTETVQAANVEAIWRNRDVWGEATCRQLLEGKIEPDMTPEMVRLAWGEATETETPGKQHARWIYRRGKKQQIVGTVTFNQNKVVNFDSPQLVAPPTYTVWVYIAILLVLSLVVSAITLAIIFWPAG
jgi:hypothetical protein